MLDAYKQVFNRLYYTEDNTNWDIIGDNILLLIEHKHEVSTTAVRQAMKQLFDNYNRLTDDVKQRYTTYFVIGVGEAYCIYNTKLQRTSLTFEDIKTMSMTAYNVANEIHSVNQIIYNELSLQKQQKTLFIASILICLKIDNNFLTNYNNITIADKIIETIDNYYSDKPFTNIFKFMSKTIKNSSIIPITNKLINIVKHSDSDVLNKFYHEFCQWNKNDDKQSGIVLTPEDIVKLMVSELSINQSDKVLDFCCGTGSFIIECGKHTDKLYACECSDERYSLAKCNFILNNYSTKNLIYSSCFDYPYVSNSFDKVIINPPFALDCQDNLNIDNNTLGWTEFTKEQRFVIYAIELLKPGGIGCMIIPRSNFDINSKNKQRAAFKQCILEQCHVLKVINCNSKVFYPVASVECAIIVLQKRKQPIAITSEYTTDIITIDYSEDGYTTHKNKRYKTSSPHPIETTKTITPSSNWNYEQLLADIGDDELTDMIMNYNIDYEASIKKLLYHQQPKRVFKPIFKQCLLTDFLRIISFKGYQTNSSQPGKYPLYGCSCVNEPVKFINNYSIDTNTYSEYTKHNGVLCINKTGNGGAGYCFIQRGRFALNPSVFMCEILTPLSNTNACYIGYQLHKIYSRGNSMNINKFNAQLVNIIVNDSECY